MKSFCAIVTAAALAGSLLAPLEPANASDARSHAGAPPLTVLSSAGAIPPAISPVGVLRAQPVTVALELADADAGNELAFDLFDEISMLGTVTRRTVMPGPGAAAGVGEAAGSITIAGRFETVPGDFVMVIDGPFVAASIRMGVHGTFRLRPTGDGHMLEQIDETLMPGCATDDIDPADIAPPADGGVAGDCADGSQIDVMVCYTPNARAAAGGTGQIEAIINLAVANANNAYVNSQVTTQLNLVLALEVDYDESGNHLNVLQNGNDGVIDGVHVLRDALGVDLVAMYVDQAGYCGVAYLLPALSTGYSHLGFSVTVWSCASLVFAHELGHNEGCCHAPGDGGGCNSGGIFDYSVGYRFNGNSGSLWRSVMAYSPGTRIPHFSNPDVLYDGQPTGVEDRIDPGAENARTINETAFTISNFRCLTDVCDGLLDLPEDCNENSVADACEIAAGIVEDLNGNTVPDLCEPVGNDECIGAFFLGNGVTPITTEVAQTESPVVPGCGTILRDVWFKYFASSTGYVTITSHDLPYDPKIVAYTGCPTDGGQILGCSENAAQTPLVFAVEPGSYRIRLGSPINNVGIGNVAVAFSLQPCLADFDGSGEIDVNDLLAMLSAWGTADPVYDIAPIGGDGVVQIQDLLAALAAWGTCE